MKCEVNQNVFGKNQFYYWPNRLREVERLSSMAGFNNSYSESKADLQSVVLQFHSVVNIESEILNYLMIFSEFFSYI